MNKFLFSFLCLGSYSFSQTIDVVPTATPVTSVLDFSYDSSGNQIKRSFRSLLVIVPKTAPQDNFLEHIQLFPVPVKNELTIKWDNKISGQIFSIGIYDHNQLKHFYKDNLNNDESQVHVNMSTYYSGLYIIQFTLSDGRIYSKTIIKK